MPPRLVLAAATALLLTAPPAATAAAPWASPSSVAAGTRVTDGPTLAFGGGGSGLLTVATNGRFGDDASVSRFRALTVTPSGRTIDRGTLPDALAVPPLVFGRDRVVLVRERVLRRATSQRLGRVRLSASFGTTRRPAGRPRTLGELTSASLPTAVAAANDRGEVAVAWIEGATFEDVRVRLALRRPNRGFDAPVTVARGVAIADVAVGLGAGGDLVVAWNRAPATGRRGVPRAMLEARVRRAGGRLGSARRLGPSRGVDRIGAAVAPNGRMVVAWATNDPGEEVNEPVEVRAAIRPAGARGFAAAQLLDGGAPVGPTTGRVLARVASDGRATVAFSALRRGPGGRGTVRPVLAASAGSNGRFAVPRALAPDGTLSSLVVAPNGTATAAWTDFVDDDEGDPTIGPVSAAVRRAGATEFGPAEAVSAPETGLLPALALPPAGVTTVAWVTDPFGSASGARVRLSRRSGPVTSGPPGALP